jgi:hypothetical protein
MMEANYIGKFSIPDSWDLRKHIKTESMEKGSQQLYLILASTKIMTILLKTCTSTSSMAKERTTGTLTEPHGTMVTGIIAKYAPKAEIHVCCVSEEMSFKTKAISSSKHLT